MLRNPQSAIRNSFSFPIHLDRTAHLCHRLSRFETGTARAFFDHRHNLIWVLSKLPASLANGAVALDDGFGQRALAIDAADARLAAIVIKTVSIRRRQEKTVHL